MFFEAYPFQMDVCRILYRQADISESPTEVDLQDAITGFLPIPIHGVAINVMSPSDKVLVNPIL